MVYFMIIFFFAGWGGEGESFLSASSVKLIDSFSFVFVIMSGGSKR